MVARGGGGQGEEWRLNGYRFYFGVMRMPWGYMEVVVAAL